MSLWKDSGVVKSPKKPSAFTVESHKDKQQKANKKQAARLKSLVADL